MKRVMFGTALAAVAILGLASPAVAAANPPVSHTLTGTVVTVDSPPDFTAPGCPAGAEWRYTAAGTAILSHLGRSEFVISHCSYFTGPTTGYFDNGTITITAANGDQLYMEQSGTFELYMDDEGALISVPSVHWTITGGTGRFTNATGAGDLAARSSNVLAPPTLTRGTLTGSITYRASDVR
jgi:hypothetical protein